VLFIFFLEREREVVLFLFGIGLDRSWIGSVVRSVSTSVIEVVMERRRRRRRRMVVYNH
jgi:predicted cation transporter